MNNYVDLARKALTKTSDDLALKVLDLLVSSPAGYSRVRLIIKCYGAKQMVANIANSTQDRAIREAIKRIRNLGVVIVSIPTEGGYRLATSKDTALVAHYVKQQYQAARSRMKTARKVMKAYGLRDVVPMDLS